MPEYNTSLTFPVRHRLDRVLDAESLLELTEEITVDYTSVVALINFLLPHFLKLSVSLVAKKRALLISHIL